MDRLEEMTYFVTKIYAIEKPEFLDKVRAVSDANQLMVDDPTKRTIMTGDFSTDPAVADFAAYVSQTAWNILSSQGYAMDQLVTYFTEMWTQVHRKFSYMETHLHPRGAQISAFYFLSVPADGCKVVIHDPRPTKAMISLFPKDEKVISEASDQIVLTPRDGMLIFTPSWLPHSFSQNESDEPMIFVHMNLAVSLAPQPEVEVI